MTWDSTKFWDDRYRAGRSSGAGSEGQAAIDKAGYVNRVIERENIVSIIDWGVGDGVVLSHINSAVAYTGVDISTTILTRLRRRLGYRGHFTHAEVAAAEGLHADMAISLDVMYHLVDDEDYERYLARLFGSAERFVLIYSTNFDDEGRSIAPHIRHRNWVTDVRIRFPQWALDEVGPWSGGPKDRAFYLYEKQS
jgi:predicted TPR repeat methyltransferase